MFKFLHTADIHLDSPLLNLEQYDGAPVEQFRVATRVAFDNLVDLAIEERVQFILVAGDLYDGDCRDSATPLHFRRQMQRLFEHEIQVFVIQGNHDAGAKKAFSFDLPQNVKLFSTKKPETVQIDELQVAVHGQGFANREVFDDLSAKYPDPIPGYLNIGMLHTSCGHHDQHTSYAPSTIRGLSDKGYDYWALGHIHKREVLAGPAPWIVYSGNTQGRHIRETGVKTCEIVSVEHQEIKQVQSRCVDVVRWHLSKVDASSCQTADEVVENIEASVSDAIENAERRPLAIRLEITGSSPAHHELHRHADHWERLVRDAMINQFDDQVWLEKIKFQTSPLQSPIAEGQSMEEQDSSHQLIAALTDLSSIDNALQNAEDEIEHILKLIPTDPRVTDDRIDLQDSKQRDALVQEVKDLLISRLLSTETPS